MKDQVYELLDFVSPSGLQHDEILTVAAVCKDNGISMMEFGDWLYKDPKRKKDIRMLSTQWDSLRGSTHPVTIASLVKIAQDQGWTPPKPEGHEIGWDDEIGPRSLRVIDPVWVEDAELPEPDDKSWNPVEDLVTYLSTLFQSDEHVGYVTESWWNEKAQKHLPQKGSWDRTAGHLIELLNKCKGDIGKVVGDWNPEVGAWIRFNPLDGKGIRDENVTDYRYALIESDDLPCARQYALIKELELPAVAVVHSGSKSIHAIVRIDADTYPEYRKRVDYLYDVCRKNGLQMDRQNRNPSRLSRMPGVTRNDHKQYLVTTNIGKASWEEWEDWIQDTNDSLPDPESLADVWDNLPPLADSLIDGLIRQGHKMLVAGPSKAGKSYALIQLCIAIAEGIEWLGWQCAQGRILYVNLELDRASCLNRFADVYRVAGIKPDNLQNIDVWNLRGSAVPMDKLTPKLIRRSLKRHYIVVVIDPIYKVITGDENSAEQMAKFCNNFDRVCKELNVAAVYCHHHSKGLQGQKMSRDRASGSGVFARDPDTLLDMIELLIDEDRGKQIENLHVCECISRYLDVHVKNWWEQITDDIQEDSDNFMSMANKLLGNDHHTIFPNTVHETREKVHRMTGWRLEGTLREYPRFTPKYAFFDFPLHYIDDGELLKDAKAAGEEPAWTSKKKKQQQFIKERKESNKLELETAFDACNVNGTVTIKELSEYMGKTERTVRNRIKSHTSFTYRKGEIHRNEK